MLRFDGLYVGPPKASEDGLMVYYDYLRFYDDGWVIECISLGTPAQVIRWFYRENPEQRTLLRDQYTLSGDVISFSPEFRDMDEGEEILMKSDYWGCIIEGGAALELRVGKSNMDNGPYEIYRFAEV